MRHYTRSLAVLALALLAFGVQRLPAAARTDLLHLSHVHRGGGKLERPDNTLETFLWCWQNGSALECDCRKTKDGVGIMLHDKTLKRTARGISPEMATRPVSKALTWDEIKDVDVGSYLDPKFSHHRIPTIEAVFAAMKGHPTWLCFVDEKGAGPEYIAKKAIEAGVQDQVYYTGPSHEKIFKWNRILPGGKSLLWLGAWPKNHGHKERARADAWFRGAMAKLREKDFKYISCVSIHSYYDPKDPTDPFVPSTSVLKEMIAEFHAHGIPVCSIPFQGGKTEEVYFKLHELGCDGFSTDYPSVMFSVIRKLREGSRALVASGAMSSLAADFRLSLPGVGASAGLGEKTIPVRLVASSSGNASNDTARLVGTLCRNDGFAISSRPSQSLGELVFDVREYGLYVLDVAAIAVDGSTNATASTTYSVVPAVKDRPREFGTCVHFQQGKGQYPLTFELLRIAGVSRVRDDLAWRRVETSPGRFSIPDAADALVARCEEYGIEPLFVFGYPNTSCYPGGFVGKPFPTDDATRKACAAALAFAVRHFGARVPAWELWNEPNYADPTGDYLPLLKFVYPAVKSARPEAKLLSGGGRGPGGGIGGGFINPIFKAGAQDFQDGWSIHPYMAPHGPDHGYHAPKSGTIKVGNVEQSMRYLQSRADKNRRSDGKALELYVTEIGWTDSAITEELQAAYLARAMFLFRRHAQGVPVYFYDFQNDGTKQDNKEHNFGVIRADYSPKPSFQAMAVAASLLANRPFTDALIDGDDYRIYGYGTEGNADFYAAWNVGKSWKDKEAPDAREVQVALPDGNWKLIDWQGRALPVVRAPDGQVLLKLSVLPSYLVRIS